jgi:hypothetical protein
MTMLPSLLPVGEAEGRKKFPGGRDESEASDPFHSSPFSLLIKLAPSNRKGREFTCENFTIAFLANNSISEK